jgi:plasmid stabilization system protein ParE
MEKEIVWTAIAQKDFWEIVLYLKTNWTSDVLNKFQRRLELKINLLQHQPNIGYKSSKYSRFRQTLITKRYKLIYSVKRKHIVILRLKHTSMQ